MKKYFVTRKVLDANRDSDLSLNDVLVRVDPKSYPDQAYDIYRIAAPGEQPFFMEDGLGGTVFWLSPFDLSSEPTVPYVRKHLTGKVMVGVDSLGGYPMRGNIDSAGDVYICLDPTVVEKMYPFLLAAEYNTVVNWVKHVLSYNYTTEVSLAPNQGVSLNGGAAMFQTHVLTETFDWFGADVTREWLYPPHFKITFEPVGVIAT